MNQVQVATPPKKKQPGAAMMAPHVSEHAPMVVEQARAVSQVQGQIVSAKHYPRDEEQAIKKILATCRNPMFAEGALYEYTKGGGAVDGGSIRLAELMAQHWGNIDFGVIELAKQEGESVMLSYCHDLESNVRSMKQFTVPHEMDTKAGAKRLESGRDIYENNANLGARRLRACIFAVIPSYVREAAEEEVKNTLMTSNEKIEVRAAKMLKAFEGLMVSKQEIEKRIGHNIEAISEIELLTLRKIHTSIKDGYKSKDEYFGVKEPDRKAVTADSPKTNLASFVRSAKPAAKPASSAPVEAELVDTEEDDLAAAFAIPAPEPKRTRETASQELQAYCKGKGIKAKQLGDAAQFLYKKAVPFLNAEQLDEVREHLKGEVEGA